MAVEGCLRWQKEGLAPPDAVSAATARYQTESDPLADFIEEACELDPSAEIRATDLHAHYNSWADLRGTPTERLTSTMFGRKMAARFERVKTRTGSVYRGLARVT